MLKDIFQVAKDCATDWQTLRDQVEDGIVPPPVILGESLRWPSIKLEQWAAEGCPRGPVLSEERCEELWDVLLLELRAADEQRKDSQ